MHDMRLLFLDTETTDLENARLIQLAYKDSLAGMTVNEYFKPPTPISYGAMAIHHITNEMVEEKPGFSESHHYANLADALGTGVVVAHNAPFDIQVLKNEGLNVSTYIDTLRIARHVLKSSQYTLQYLRYSLHLEVAHATAHDALGDIRVLEALYAHLKKIVTEKFTLTHDNDIIQKMISLSGMPVLLTTITFGKYRGRLYEEVCRSDRGYLEWLYASEMQKDLSAQNEELVFTLKNYLENRDNLEIPF